MKYNKKEVIDALEGYEFNELTAMFNHTFKGQAKLMDSESYAESVFEKGGSIDSEILDCVLVDRNGMQSSNNFITLIGLPTWVKVLKDNHRWYY